MMAASSSVRILLASGERLKDRQVRRGVEWLRRAQSSAGGWRGSEYSEAGELGHTALAALALVEAGEERSASSITRAVEYLLRETRVAKLGESCTPEDLALGIGALVALGFSRDSVVVLEPLKALLLVQEEDGGWSRKSSESSHVGHTALVLNALLDSGLSWGSEHVEKGVGFLLSRRNIDGGWAERWRELSVPHTTACVLALLCRLS